MDSIVLGNVSMDLDSSHEERAEHQCDFCHVSYTTDTELRDHQWSLMHHIKMEKQKKGSVHNCTLCFMTCANIIEYGKHLNEEKHKRAIEDYRRQKEEEDLLMGNGGILMAKIKEKEEMEKTKQQNKKKSNHGKGKVNGDNNLSDPDSSNKKKAIGKRRSDRLNQRMWGSGMGHQRSSSLPGRNADQRSRNFQRERQSHNDDLQVDSMTNNFQNPTWGTRNGHYGQMHQNHWDVNMGFQQGFNQFPDQNYQQSFYDNGQYYMYDNYERNGQGMYARGMRGNMFPDMNEAYYNDPNIPHELENSSGVPEKYIQWVEPSHGFQDNYSPRGRRTNRWSKNNTPRNSLRTDNFRGKSNQNADRKPSHSHGNQNNDGSGKDFKEIAKPKDKTEHSHTDIKLQVTDEVLQSTNCRLSPKSDRSTGSLRESRNRSESYEKGGTKRRRYNSPSHSTEQRRRQDKESKNTHIRFADDEDVSEKPVRFVDEADSTTSSADKEDLSSSSSGRNGGRLKEKKKGILKKKKKNGVKGSPPGSPKRSSKKGEKGGEGVLEKAEKLCKELREKREKAKLERERKMKAEQKEKLENINQELKTLSDKSKEYVKGHISAEETTQSVDSSAKNRTGSEKNSISKLSQSNKEIEKIRQNIEKSVQSVNEIQKLQSSSGKERNSRKEDSKSSAKKSETSTNKSKTGLQETSVREPSKKDTKPDSCETRKGKEGTVNKSSAKEKLTTDSLLKMVNSPRSRKERQQLAGMLRSYAQSQKKLSLPRYNLELSGSYDNDLDGKIEELRLEELSPEVQIQIAQLMEADATPDLNDLEMALMSSSDKAKKIDKKSDSRKNSIASQSDSLNQYQESDKTLKGSSKERSRTMSTESDKKRITEKRRKDSDTTQPQKPSEHSSHTSVIVKSEPMDTEYDKPAQISSTSPDITTGLVTSTTCLGENEKTLSTSSAVPLPRMPQFSNQLPQKTSTQGDVPLPTLSGSMSSLESGRSTESLFDTVYDISVKEEALRKEITEVDQFIQYFRNVIDEATIQLNRYNERKLRLQSEDEKWRGRRLRILHEAKFQQRSGQSTPQLSEFEDQIGAPAREDRGKAVTLSQTSHNSEPQVSSYNDPHTSTLLNVLNRNQRLEPERDRQGCASSSFGTANSSVHANPNTNASDSILAQLRNLSSNLQKEAISMETENKSDNRLPRDFASIKKKPEEDNPVAHGSLGGTTMPASFKSSVMEDTRTKAGDGLNKGTKISSDTQSLPPKPVKSTTNPVNRRSESSDVRNSLSITHSADLKDAGFITLNSLIKTSNLNEAIDSDDEPLANVMRRQRQDSLRSEESQNKGESDDSANEGKKFNMQYVGTLGVDSKEFLNQLGNRQGSGQDQGPSYMVLDKDSDAYQHIQSLIKGGRTDSCETSVAASQNTDSKEKDNKSGTRRIRGLRSGHASDSNYESVNSNCSLGEQIRQYANLNKKGSKQGEVTVINTDSDSEQSDRTIQENPALLSDSCTPVRMVTSCSTGIQNLNLDSSPLLAASQQIRHGREEERTAPVAEESRSLSPFRKKLRTKKERDRISLRKQKEGYVLDSSSDGGNSADGESVPKLTDIKQQLVFKSLSNIPAALKAEGLDSEEAGLVETGSEDTEQVILIKQEGTAGEQQRSLLEDVQLETESEDNRQLAVEAKERLSLDKKVMENFRKAVENMKSTLGLSALQIPEDSCQSLHREPVQFQGPKEIISGLDVFENFLYVSYQGKIIKRFNLLTGELNFEFNTMSYNVLCILVSKEKKRLYVGTSEMMLLSYCCETKKPLKVEATEGKPQCFCESWGHLYMGTDCGTVVVMSLKNDKVLDTFHCADRSISRICSATEGVRRVILVASFDAIIYVYDSNTGLLIRMLEGHTRTPFSLQVDDHLVFSGSGDKTVMEHSISTGELLWTYTEAAGIVSCVCTHGDQLFSASYDRLIRCYNKKSRKLLRLYYGAGAAEALIIKMTISQGMLITGNRTGLVEAVPISEQNHTCQCSECDFVFASRTHLVYHVVHDHVISKVRPSKKTPCPWKNCKEKFQSTSPKEVIEEHIIVHAYS